MLTLPVELLREFRKGYFSQRQFYKFEFSSKTYRWTDADKPVYVNLDGSALWWEPKAITFESFEGSLEGIAENVPIIFDNVTWDISSICLAEDITFRPVYIYKGNLDRNLDLQGSLLVFYGFCDRFSFDEEAGECVIEVSDYRIMWKKKTLRTHDPTCAWIFKDATTCQYAGAEAWCDHSWERCGELSNQVNFPGFRWIQYLEDKQILWGRKTPAPLK